MRECHNEVEQEDEDRQSNVEDILRKSTDFLRRIILPVEGQEESPCRTCACIPTRLKIHLVGLLWARREAVQLVVCSLRPVRLEGPVHGLGHTRQHGPPKCFRAHGMCDNLINALKLLANLQIDGDGPVKMVVQGLQERSRPRLMDGLRKFIMVENHEAVKVGEPDKNMESRKVVKPKFTTDFLEAVVREGSDELTLRADGEGALRTFIDTTNVGDKRDGSHRSWMRTRTPSARPFSKGSRDHNGRPCSASM